MPWPWTAEIGIRSPRPSRWNSSASPRPRVVELVRDDEHGAARPTEDLGQLLVAGRDAGSRVDDEEDEVGLLDGLRAWAATCGPKGRVGPVHATGVDQAEGRARPLRAAPCGPS